MTRPAGCWTLTSSVGSAVHAASNGSTSNQRELIATIVSLIDGSSAVPADTAGVMLANVTMDRRTVLQTGLAMAATRGRTAPRSYVLQVLGQGG